MTKEKVVLASSLQEKDSCIMQLKEDMDKMQHSWGKKTSVLKSKATDGTADVGQAAQTSSSAHQPRNTCHRPKREVGGIRLRPKTALPHQGLENRLVDKEQGVAGGKVENITTTYHSLS
ncbi:hypothetical protein GWK47_002138 [Chionoecetes opilio]|uniref:Uncharacterized protein n=1 Tax=Chionoecetes opilio TaxID=41210 RepID=A0A8J4XUR7_CHIOP|nr:hypothetical protein GWK47_002138 [Chionoecetes opilio]